MFSKGKIMLTSIRPVSSLKNALVMVALLTMSACAGFGAPPVNIGDTEAEVVAKLGAPTHRYQLENGRVLEYARGPWGQETHMARIGPDGRLANYEQVLKREKFAELVIGKTTKQDVLRTIGAPSETSYLRLKDLEVWSYPYKENDVWNSIMHVQFDRNGIVDSLVNTQDLRYDQDGLFPFGFMGM